MRITVDDLRGEPIRLLLEEHLAHMRCISPPESVHALDIEALRHPSITFWTAWEGEALLGCGALKQLDAQQAELKSMRTANGHQRKGVARAMLQHILAEARLRGYTRLSLETGPAHAFGPAHTLYTRVGFTPCGPFGSYGPDPFSVFMTLDLNEPPRSAASRVAAPQRGPSSPWSGPAATARTSPGLLTVSKCLPQGHGLAPALLRRAATVELDWDVRQKSRFDATDSQGRQWGVFLPRGTLVRGGDVLVAEDGSLIRVLAAPQPVLVITHCKTHGTPFDLTRAAYHLGNRHVPIELQPDHLKIEPDHVLADMLRAMHLIVNAAESAFEPEGGAYASHAGHTGHGHSGHDHDHGAAHDHDTPHDHSHHGH